MAAFPKGFEQLPDATTSAAVVAKRIVQRHTNGTIRHAVADSDMVGVTMEAGASGTTPNIGRLKAGAIFDVNCTTAGAVAIGDYITAAANGQGVATSTANKNYIGIALTAKTAATAGDVKVQIQPGQVPA